MGRGGCQQPGVTHPFPSPAAGTVTKEVLRGRQIRSVPHQGAVSAATMDSSSSRQAPAARHARRRLWLHSGITRRHAGSSARMCAAYHRGPC